MKVIVVAGAQAGVGKTTFAVGLMAALRQRGLRVQGFKVGPDLLDPLLHEAATGRPSFNLDGWMLSREYNLACVSRLAADADVAVVEGGETLFDGDDDDERGSAGQIAKWLGAPVLLVVDCAAQSARSVAALLKGYLAFDDELAIAGVVLNKTRDAAHERLVEDSIARSVRGVPVFGAMRRDDGAGALRDGGADRRGPSGFAAAAAKAALALRAGGGASIGRAPRPSGGDVDGDRPAKGSNPGSADDPDRLPTFVTGVAAQLAHVVGDGVDLNALMQAAWEFVAEASEGEGGGAEGGADRDHADGGEEAKSARDSAAAAHSAAAAAVAGPDGTTPAEDLAAGPAPPQSPRTPHRTSALKGETFGGKDLSKFPSIPESPKATPSPNKSPSRKKSLGRNLVEGVASHLGPAMRLGRGVGNSASHLIPRPLFSGRDGVRVAIARDAAFCHYYRENLALLEASGADLVPFSPIAGDGLPPGCKGVLLGGGYPELYASELTQNRPLRVAITAFAAAGGAIYAECGGLVFLSQSLSDGGAQPRPMCGLAPFATRVVLSSNDTTAAPGAAASGYATVTVREGCPLFPAGASARGYIHRNSEIVSEPALSSAPGGPGASWFAAYDTKRGGFAAEPEERVARPGSERVARAGSDDAGSGSVSVAAAVRRLEAGNDLGRGLGRVEGYAWRNVVTSYARLHFGDAPELAQHFVDACRAVPAGAAEAALKAASATRKTPPSTQGSVPSTPQLGRVASTDSLQLQMQLQHTSSEGSLSGGGGHGPGDGSGDATPAGAGTPSNKSGYAGSSGGHTPAGGSSSQLAPRDEKYRPAHRRAHSDDVDGGGAMGAGAGAMGTGAGIGKSRSVGVLSNLFPRQGSASSGGGLSDAGNGVRRTASSATLSDLDPEAALSFPPASGLQTVASMVGLSAGDEYGDVGHLHSPCETPQPAPSRTCTVASLTPAATEIVHALGLQSRLVCVTDRCDYPTTVARSFPIVLRSRLGVANDANRRRMGGRRDSISSAMHAAAREGAGDATSGYVGASVGASVDVEWLRRVRPGLVLTQDACERCVGGPGDSVVARALASAGLLGGGAGAEGSHGHGDPENGDGDGVGRTGVLAMDPQRLSEVMEVIARVGAATGEEDAALALVGQLRARLRAVAAAVAGAERRPRVLSLEGLRPLAVGGHWLPEMKVLAGGVDELQEPGAPAVSLRWEQVLTYAPEVLILAPCVSTSPEQTLAEIDKIAAQPGWWAMPAVRDREVYVVHHALFSRAGPRLVNGVELLAKILHPSLAPDVKMREGGGVLKMCLEPGRRCRANQLRKFFKPWGGAGPDGMAVGDAAAVPDAGGSA